MLHDVVHDLWSYHRAAALGGSHCDLLLSVLHGVQCSRRRLSYSCDMPSVTLQ